MWSNGILIGYYPPRFDGKKLVIELFSNGNIILVEHDKCIAALRYESWKDREIKKGCIYAYPTSRRYVPRVLKFEDFKS